MPGKLVRMATGMGEDPCEEEGGRGRAETACHAIVYHKTEVYLT